MQTLVCTVNDDVRELVESHGTHTYEQLVLSFKRPSQVIFLDIDIYWAAVKRGAP